MVSWELPRLPGRLLGIPEGACGIPGVLLRNSWRSPGVLLGLSWGPKKCPRSIQSTGSASTRFTLVLVRFAMKMLLARGENRAPPATSANQIHIKCFEGFQANDSIPTTGNLTSLVPL